MNINYILIFIFILICIIFYYININYNDDTIESIHKKLTLKYGNMKEELPEQIMINKHIKHNSKILELGPNIGRSSLIANNKLSRNNKENHLCVEGIKDTCNKLKKNRDINNMKFKIFEGVISDTPLYQSPHSWRSRQTKKEGDIELNSISLKKLISNYNIQFDTIIADCEGCLSNILNENEWFLNNIKLIILEHDFNSNKDLNTFKYLMDKYNFKMKDHIKKGENGAPSVNWKDGISTDDIFVSVWEK